MPARAPARRPRVRGRRQHERRVGIGRASGEFGGDVNSPEPRSYSPHPARRRQRLAWARVRWQTSCPTGPARGRSATVGAVSAAPLEGRMLPISWITAGR